MPNIRFLLQKEVKQAHEEVYKANEEWANIASPQPTAEQQNFMTAEPPMLEITLPQGATLPEGIIVPEGIILASSTEEPTLITLPMDATTEEQTLITLPMDATTGEQTLVTLPVDATTEEQSLVTLPVDAATWASLTGDQPFTTVSVENYLPAGHTEGQVFIHPSIREGHAVIQLVPGSA